MIWLELQRTAILAFCSAPVEIGSLKQITPSPVRRRKFR
jgi:hypothetical protein